MIKDVHLRIIFIPLLGICLPLASGIISYKLYSFPQIAGALLFFMLTSASIWMGCNWIHSKLRPLYTPISNPFRKLFIVCGIAALYGACIGGLYVMLWAQISKENFGWNGIYKFVALCVFVVILFTLVYEILFLSKEKERDTKMVKRLGREKNQAELQALANELDPHFIFNSLNALNHLILNNPTQAHMFNNKLAQVYKYFLINRNRELITLEDELEFIANYFYLLQIRHDDKMELSTDLGENYNSIMIPPCALQILVENAIKHNEFSDNNPLQVMIAMNGQYLKVSNNVKPKPYSVNSTGIGLRNLSSRYKIICHRDIVIETSREKFTVKLPLIR